MDHADAWRPHDGRPRRWRRVIICSTVRANASSIRRQCAPRSSQPAIAGARRLGTLESRACRAGRIGAFVSVRRSIQDDHLVSWSAGNLQQKTLRRHRLEAVCTPAQSGPEAIPASGSGSGKINPWPRPATQRSVPSWLGRPAWRRKPVACGVGPNDHSIDDRLIAQAERSSPGH